MNASRLLIFLSILTLGGAFIWWRSFYASALPPGTQLPLECLFRSAEFCSVVGTGSQIIGGTPYQPVVFWLGLIGLVAGLILRQVAGRSARSRSRPPF